MSWHNFYKYNRGTNFGKWSETGHITHGMLPGTRISNNNQGLLRLILRPSPFFDQNWWINSLWPSDAIWRQRSGSTLTQVMACCLTAPSHYLNQCWLVISKVQWYLSEGNFTIDTSAMNHINSLENYLSKISSKISQGTMIRKPQIVTFPICDPLFMPPPIGSGDVVF